MTQSIDAQLSHCIQSANSIGGTTYYNICSHTTQWVPWGSADWAGALLLGAFSLVVFAVIASFAYMAATS